MGYQMSNGRWADTKDVTLQGSATKTADGQSSGVEMGDSRVLRLLLTASISGTAPTFDVTVQGSPDNTNWHTLGTFAQLTASGSERKTFLAARYARVSWAITGDDAGSVSAVTKSGSGPNVTITGTPAVDGSGLITITTGGARGTAEFSWSYGAESDTGVLTAATVVLGTTGLTAAFATGTYVEDDEYSWTGDDPDPDTQVTFSVIGEAA